MTEFIRPKPERARQILLVDDDKDFTEFFKDFLVTFRPGAWVVHTADHYAPALACLKANPIDLAVLDLKMPVMDGLQLLTLLKKTHPGLPVIILTASVMTENRDFCLKNGAALFFDKSEVSGGLDKIYAALEAVVSTPTEGFRGMLRQVGLTDVLQMECLARKSSVLEVNTRSGAGRIYIHDGSIIHADFGTQQGEPALFKLLGQSGGEFHLKPYLKPTRQTIDGHWESLVMEAARLQDEAAGAGESAEAVPARPEPPPQAGAERQIQEIVLCSTAGELLYEWQSPRVERRMQLLDLISNISDSLSQSLHLSRGDRLEVLGQNSRVVMLLQSDRKLLVRSGGPIATSTNE